MYSREYDIYGCINSTDKWGSEAFIALGLRDDMNFQMSPSSPIDRGMSQLYMIFSFVGFYFISCPHVLLFCLVSVG